MPKKSPHNHLTTITNSENPSLTPQFNAKHTQPKTTQTRESRKFLFAASSLPPSNHALTSQITAPFENHNNLYHFRTRFLPQLEHTFVVLRPNTQKYRSHRSNQPFCHLVFDARSGRFFYFTPLFYSGFCHRNHQENSRGVMAPLLVVGGRGALMLNL